MILSVVWLACASIGILNSLLLVYGLYRDNRLLLVPWIFTMVITMLFDLLHIIYMFIVGTMTFEPLKAMLFTMDFFLLSLNLYSLLCVVSQYQEFKAGRGRRDNNVGRRVPPVKYVPHNTATSGTSSRRPVGCPESRASTTHSPTAPHSTLLTEDSGTASKLVLKSCLRKHVKFPDEISMTIIRNPEFSDGSSEGGQGSSSAKEDMNELPVEEQSCIDPCVSELA